MPELAVIRGNKRSVITFSAGQCLKEVLTDNEIIVSHPCGGRGTCGKCAVQLTGYVSEPNAYERKLGMRLSCQAILLGNAQVILPEQDGCRQITFSDFCPVSVAPMPGQIGAAVDIGTTTIACRLFDLCNGKCLAETGTMNPQSEVAADVIGRIEAALTGKSKRLQALVYDSITMLLQAAYLKCGLQYTAPDSVVIAGNTTMLYLLMGRNPETLSHAPFQADHLFDETIPAFSLNTYLPPCMNAFVGADITCAVLASGICTSGETSLLVDIGTNGEIALWKDGILYVTSTAAGPVFEGAGISCGCGSVQGAIDHVWVENGKLVIHTIDDVPASGICGSGLIDAIAAFLQLGLIDETGVAAVDCLELCDGIALLPKDVRAVQLAKAAIAAGIETLMNIADVQPEEICTLFIAGGFGSHLTIDSAVSIGLIPETLSNHVQILGNASLAGASALLLDIGRLQQMRSIVSHAQYVNLGGNPLFNENYIKHIMFE